MKRFLGMVVLLVTVFVGEGYARDVKVLRDGWSFHRGEIVEENKLQWEKVQIPHDWAIYGPFDLNEDNQYVKVIEDGDKDFRLRTGRTGALPATGIGWYRRTLKFTDEDLAQNISLEFDGVMSNAKVYVNRQLVTERPYGYISFACDITKYLQADKENLLEVRVENELEMSRFYAGAGIYRPVRLVKKNRTSISHWGTYVTTPKVSKSKATAHVVTQIDVPNGGPVKLLSEILDASGAVIAKAEKVAKSVDGVAEVVQDIVVRNPLLWDVESPHLYTLRQSVVCDKEVVDVENHTIGFRSIEFDANKGFMLNGRILKLKGVCLHHDLGPIGAAVSRRATERQLEIMQRMGCNAIRTTHNPPSMEMLELCDRMGFLVIDEAFDEWREGKCLNGYNNNFDEWAERDLTDFIRRDRNHPCVIMWSIGNEVREQSKAEGAGIARYLSEIAHREDPTRPTTAGYNFHADAMKYGLTDAVDVVGYNYEHNDDYARYHREHPDYIIYGSETCSAISSRGVYKFPVKDNRDPWYSDYQVSSYGFDYVPWGCPADDEFAHQDDYPFVLGEFVWTGFDYLGEPTPYGEGAPSRSSYFGLVDLAGLPKDNYYLYQSHWSDTPVLHVLPHWTWPERVGEKTPVVCYTNYPEAELFVNGKSMGVQRKDASKRYGRYRLVWDEVLYEPGEVKVVAHDASGKACAEEIVKTAGNPHSVKLTADRSVLKADGEDLSFVTIEIQDENGNLCPHSSAMVFVKVKGNGRLRALCNGDATDLTPFSSNYMQAFSGKLVAVIETDKNAGDIEVVVSSERLKPATLKLETK